MSTLELADDLQFILELVQHASILAMDIYQRDFSVDFKSADDPVTEADRRVNEHLCTAIRDRFPHDLVIGEESGFDGEIPESGRIWFVDPVDGTSDFVKKNGEWSIMVGLVVDGVPIMGAVLQPATDELFYASQGAGAWLRDATGIRCLHVVNPSRPQDAIVVGSRSHPDPRIEAVKQAVGLEFEYTHGSVGCKLGHIASQRAHVYFNFSGRCHMWDTAGPEIILEEAGGMLVDLHGQRIRYTGGSTLVTQPFVATVPSLLQPLRDYFDLRPDLQEER
jgi:3'(2'), 5'-bisphosphate nucleotidase